MKALRTLIAGVFFSMLLIFSHASASFAEEMEHKAADVQSLRDGAAALKAINPELSEKLSKYADEEANEKEEAEEQEEMEEHEEGNIKLLSDSAAALQASNPQLADSLKKYADKEAAEGQRRKEIKQVETEYYAEWMDLQKDFEKNLRFLFRDAFSICFHQPVLCCKNGIQKSVVGYARFTYGWNRRHWI